MVRFFRVNRLLRVKDVSNENINSSVHSEEVITLVGGSHYWPGSLV